MNSHVIDLNMEMFGGFFVCFFFWQISSLKSLALCSDNILANL